MTAAVSSLVTVKVVGPALAVIWRGSQPASVRLTAMAWTSGLLDAVEPLAALVVVVESEEQAAAPNARAIGRTRTAPTRWGRSAMAGNVGIPNFN